MEVHEKDFVEFRWFYLNGTTHRYDNHPGAFHSGN